MLGRYPHLCSAERCINKLLHCVQPLLNSFQVYQGLPDHLLISRPPMAVRVRSITLSRDPSVEPRHGVDRQLEVATCRGVQLHVSVNAVNVDGF